MKWTGFNDDWLFWEDQDAFAMIWSVPDHAQTVHLPHDAMISRQAHADSAAGGDGAYRDGGSFVYYKELYAPEHWKEKTVRLCFEGISSRAMVYINGQRASLVPYAYTTFYVELDSYLRYGQMNGIRVQARTGDMPNSRWYAGGGIYRDVYLLEGSLVYIPPQGLRLMTKDLQKDWALVRVEADLVSRLPVRTELTVEIGLYAPDGTEAVSETVPLTLAPNGTECVSRILAVPDPVPWSDRSPSLYTCRVRLLTETGMQEEADTCFGIRTISADARRGLLVNGRSVKLRGGCIHHDNGLLGAASFEDAEYRRIRLMKEAGFNAVRSAHNPLSPAALRACDELGVYVMDEAFDMWTRSKKDYDYSQFFELCWQDDLAAMVRKDYNHPSVILYSIGNEIPEISTDQGAALCREMSRLVKSLDDTRPVMAGINGMFAAGDGIGEIMEDITGEKGGTGGGNVNDFMAATADHADEITTHAVIGRVLEKAGAGLDIIGYNYMTARYEPDGEAYPNRVMVGSETYPPEIARNWEIIERMPQVIGDFTWAGWDYIGEAGVGVPAYHPGEGSFGAQFPCQLAYVGDIDITGYRRPASYFRQIVFGLRQDPYITVQDPAHYGKFVLLTPWVISDSDPSWTYPGMEGKPLVVEVYSPGDETVLLLNGEEIGRAAAGKAAGYRTLFETTYQPGVLEAVSYEDGAVIGHSSLQTVRGPLSLHLLPEETDGRELVYVNIILADADGVCGPQDVILNAKVTGDGALAGFGSADPKPLEGYTTGRCSSFHGRAQAILRKNSDAGEMLLMVSADGYEPAEIRIRY